MCDMLQYNYYIINFMRKYCIILLLVLSLCQCRYFTIKNRRFYDPQNGEITFHGIGWVQKEFPYETPAKKEDVQKIKSWGLNSIRTDISWPGLILQNGEVNQTYLKHKIDMINFLGENQIYTLLQFHQDLFSEKFCADGVPPWLIPEEISHDFGRPVIDQIAAFREDNGFLKDKGYCHRTPQWANFYKTYAVNRGFWALYNNQYGLLDEFKKYWRILATAFKNNPYIIAYQIINEPWPGNMYKNPLIMIPGLSQVFNLRRFHDQVARTIRQIDPDQNIGFQPVTWSNVFPAGYSHPPGGKQFADRSVLCFHYYKPPTMNIGLYMAARRLDMKRLKVGGLLTEFMAAPGCSSDPQDLHPQILDKCDQYHVGWFAWRYYEHTSFEFLVRVYAQRVGGTIIEQKFIPKTGQYLLYYQSQGQSGETVIFFPKEQYPNGFIMTIEPKTKYEIINQRYIIIDSKFLGKRLVSFRIEKVNEGNGDAWVKKEQKKMQQSEQSKKKGYTEQQLMIKKERNKQDL